MANMTVSGDLILKKNNVTDASGNAIAPAPTALGFGEIAVNYSSKEPCIFFKDDKGKIIKIVSEEAITRALTDILGNSAADLDTLKELLAAFQGSANDVLPLIASKADKTALNAHTNSRSNPHQVTKGQVGLSNVTNTSDASKPVSTAQQTALNKKFDKTGGTVTGNVVVMGNVGTKGSVSEAFMIPSSIVDNAIFGVRKGGNLMSFLRVSPDMLQHQDKDGAVSTLFTTKNLTPKAILDKLKTVDGTGSGLDADFLDGKQLSELTGRAAYDPSEGFLIKTNFKYGMFNIVIKTNGYTTKGTDFITGNFYSYRDSNTFYNYNARGSHQCATELTLFYLDDKVCIWVPRTGSAQSLIAEVNVTSLNVGSIAKTPVNAVAEIIDSAIPVGVVSKITVPIIKIWDSRNSNLPTVDWNANILTYKGMYSNSSMSLTKSEVHLYRGYSADLSFTRPADTIIEISAMYNNTAQGGKTMISIPSMYGGKSKPIVLFDSGNVLKSLRISKMYKKNSNWVITLTRTGALSESSDNYSFIIRQSTGDGDYVLQNLRNFVISERYQPNIDESYYATDNAWLSYNSNLPTVDWNARDFFAERNVIAKGEVSAYRLDSVKQAPIAVGGAEYLNELLDVNVTNAPIGSLLYKKSASEWGAINQASLKPDLSKYVLTTDARLSNARPASDVYSWAKGTKKPVYGWGEVTGKPTTFAPNHSVVDWDDINTDSDWGFYSGASGGPLSGSSIMGISVPLRSAPGYSMQLGARNDELYFRTKETAKIQPWRKIWHDGNLTGLRGEHYHDKLIGATISNLNLAGTGTYRFSYDRFSGDATNAFPVSHNANGVITLNTHAGEFYHQLGFSSNGSMYRRANRTGAWMTFMDSANSNLPTVDWSAKNLYAKENIIAKGEVTAYTLNGVKQTPSASSATILSDLADVDLTGAKAGDVLQLDGSVWKSKPKPTFSTLEGVPTAFAPTEHNHVGSTYNVSDERLKQNIEPLTNGLELILSMHPVNYGWKDEAITLFSLDKAYSCGLIAQELERLLPNVVGQIDEQYKGVNYVELVPYLIGAVKQLHENIASQNIAFKNKRNAENKHYQKEVQNAKILSALQAENKELKGRLERLETLIKQ